MRRLLLLVWLGLAACSDEAPPQVTPGSAAPPFSAPGLDGRQLAFPGEFPGKALAVVFWNEACPPCIRELQEIEQVHRRSAHPLPILAIHVGQDKTSAAALVHRLGLGFPVLFDEDGAIARRYGVIALPTTYFIDPAGKLRSKLVGKADAASFTRQALDLIAAPAVTPR
jgi:peroxiredoxin